MLFEFPFLLIYFYYIYFILKFCSWLIIEFVLWEYGNILLLLFGLKLANNSNSGSSIAKPTDKSSLLKLCFRVPAL